jgi:uncharacterized protein (TIGR00730 family)
MNGNQLPTMHLPTVAPGKRVAVFAGSSATCPAHYRAAAREFGDLLASNGCALVYGSGSWGLMGEVALGAADAPIVGVLPEFMLSTAGDLHGQTIVVSNMAERKHVINELAEIFVGLPGGFGTLDEMSEMLTWNQIGVNNKLVVFVNIAGYYDQLGAWVERALSDGFIRREQMQNFVIVDTPEAAIQVILTREPQIVPGKFRTKA